MLGFVHKPAIMKVPQRLAERHLASQVPDPVLREKLRPDYRIGCKRILISNDWYPALSRDTADLVTSGIAEVNARSIVDRDGVERPADVIVFATGLEVTPPPIGTRVHGRDGRTLAEHWSEKGMTALRGCTVAGFPNLFLIVGPNTGLGHNSIVHIVESQVAYVLDALRTMRERGVKAVAPRPEAQERWNAGVQKRMAGSIWSTGGCASWYLAEHGNNVTLWPGACGTLRRETKRFDPAEYELVA